LTRRWLIKRLGLQPSRYYQWQKRRGLDNRHNGKTPREHWLLPEEREAILSYCQDKLEEGYRRLTYMMLDADIVAVSPATTYRLLKNAGLLNRWAPSKRDAKKGFDQPLAVHEHWHIDISYVNILGTMYFMTTVLDGRSRYIVHHELKRAPGSFLITGHSLSVRISRSSSGSQVSNICEHHPIIRRAMEKSSDIIAPSKPRKFAAVRIAQSKTPDCRLLATSTITIPSDYIALSGISHPKTS